MSIIAMKQALDALEHEAEISNDNAYKHERDALREAIEQAELVQRAEEAFDRSERYVMVNAQGNLERISLVQTNVGIGKQAQPVAWMQEMPLQENEIRSVRMTSVKEVAEDWDQPIPLYTTPPPCPWVGLTDEDCEEVERWVEFKEEGSGRIPTGKLIRYIETKLKEKTRIWVGLSTDEFKFIASKYLLSREVGLEYFQEEIEAKLKEKNT